MATCKPKRQRELVNIVIVGHVDHGKSTLVGRLLADTNSFPKDRLDKVKSICRKQGKAFEYAFLLDAFREEQRQGITIDVSQVRFSTTKRDYSLIDVPGHKEFLKNMFSGASRADAAVLIVDASLGVQFQTKQHAYLLSMLGIGQVVVVISKMDLVDYSESEFNRVKKDCQTYFKTIHLRSKTFITVDAKNDIHVFKRYQKMRWYQGKTVCAVLDDFHGRKNRAKFPFRFVIQDVYKFDGKRLIVGRIASGTVKVGDEVLFSPGNQTAKVKSLVNWPHKEAVKAVSGQSIAITLDDELFIERGQVGSHNRDYPHLADEFCANLFWMSKKPLLLNHPYLFRLGAQEILCVVKELKYIVTYEDSESSGSSKVKRYDVARVVMKTKRPIVLDDFNNAEELSRFVLIDKNQICGGGITELDKYPDLRQAESEIVKSKNITWHLSEVTEGEREVLSGHKGAVVWLTGLPGSGKSTIASQLEKALIGKGVHAFVLDGDNIRHGLNANLGFSADDRAENIRRIGEVAKLFSEAGMIVITAFISPYESGRRKIRERLGDKFVEVYVDCPLEICERRDPKGLYKKAREGKIAEFTGISAPYEPPQNPEVIISTHKENVQDCIHRISQYLVNHKIIQDSFTTQN